MIDLNFPPIIINWIIAMISNRNIKLNFKGKEIIKMIEQGCPQGGILSPLLWNITLNLLLKDSNIDPEFVQAFADDMVILVQGIDLKTIKTIAKNHLIIIDTWCKDNGLKLSKIKTKIILFRMKGRAKNIKPIKIKGDTIEFTKSTKFLGVIIDEFLNWNEHITGKCAKAKKLLFKCKNAVNKNWGLSPDKIKWIYQQVILPQITYSAFVWIHKAEETVKIREMLNKVQRLANIMITGAIFTTPNETLNIMAGNRPIVQQLKLAAVKTAIRLDTNKDWQPNRQLDNRKKNYYHTSITDPILNQTKSYKHNDLLPKTNMQKKYKVNPFQTEETREIIQSIPIHYIKIYTDGSLIKDQNNNIKSGAGIYITKNGKTAHEKSIPLGNKATINQCEMYAIKHAVQWVNDQNLESQSIYLFSDSQTALYTLNKQMTQSKLTIETNKILNETGTKHNIFLTKVPAHVGLEGNEKADILAKKGAENCTGNENIIKNSYNNIINEIENKLFKEQIKQIKKSNISDKGKLPAINILQKYKYKLSSKNKKTLRNLTHIVTGHNMLNHSRNNRIKSRSPYCNFCPNIRETSDHFMGKCPAYANTRMHCFNKDKTSLEQIIQKNKIQDINRYISQTNRLKCYEKE